MRYAVVDESGVTVNVVLWDGESDWAPADGLTLLALADDSLVQPGDTIDKHGEILSSVEPSPPDPIDVSLDSATVDSVRDALTKATTIAGVKNALGPLLEALGGRG